MKARITAIVNQKGGVGKSTTAETMLSGLTARGFRVLAVDLDPQGNLTYSTRVDDGGPTIFGVLVGECRAVDAVRRTDRGDVVPSGRMLASLGLQIPTAVGGVGREYVLREALKPLLSRYDHVILDTPPALGTLTVNALTAAHGAVIPCHADAYSIQGVGHMAEEIATVRKHCNPGLAVDGLLLTRFSPRAVVRRELASLASTVASGLGTRVFHATIREAVAVTEAQLEGRSIFDHAPRSKVAEDYTRFLDEWTEMVGATAKTMRGE